MDETRLIEYALDLLDAPTRDEAERAIGADAGAKARLSELRHDLGLIALAPEPVAPTPALRERILDATAPQPRYGGMVARLSAFLDLAAEQVERLLLNTHQIARPIWKTLAPGISVMPIKAGPARRSQRCALVLMEADTQFPSHTHPGDEWALLIDGHVRESTGRELHSGDHLYKPAGSTHAFCTSDAACLFAVAAARDLA